MDFETKAIHVGQEPDPSFGSTIPPVHLTSTFAQQGLGENKGHEYARVSNPTRDALERCLAALEDGAECAAFASGMAAETAILSSLRPGDGVVAGFNIYGGTYRLFEQVYKPWGLEVIYAEDDSPAAYKQAIAKLSKPKMVWLETPTNPLLTITDIAAVAQAAHAANSQVIVDNTFATPYLQRPFELGADVIVHSLTKYLGGHSDVVSGAVITKTPGSMQPFRFYQKSAGGIPSPFECWLVQRGLKTLSVRMERHCDNAEQLARALQSMPGINDVVYPGLDSHPDHHLAGKQMRRFGGIVSARIDGGVEGVRKFVKRVKLFAVGESLGGVESLLAHPATMSHAGMSPEARAERGIDDGLVRFSVGIESASDIIEDVRQALA